VKKREILQNTEDLKNLWTVFFFQDNIFAVGKQKNQTSLPKEYILFKVHNARPFGRFNLGKEFKLLKSDTAPNLNAHQVTGILDKCTNQIYPMNIWTLLHLGALSVNIGPHDKLLSKDKDTIKLSKRIQVLGLHAPALYFINLHKICNHEAKNKQK
jgi:hypothetical protein